MNLNISYINNKGFLALLVCIMLLSFKVNAQEVITLQKALDRTLERNLTIKNAQLNEALDVENYNQAKNNRLPNLNANPQATLNFGRSPDVSSYQYVNQRVFAVNGGLSSQVSVYQGGLLKNQILQNKLQLDVDKSNTAKVKNDLVLNVITTYLSVLSNRDLLTASTQQVDISKQTLDRVQKTFDVGNGTLADLSQAKATLSTSELNQTTAQNNLDISILTLKQYMEMDPKTPITVEKPDVSKLTDVKSVFDAQGVFESSVIVNPDVRLAELQKQTAFQGIKVARSYYYPTISLQGSLGSYYSDANKLALFGDQLSNNFTQGLVLGVQVPIFGRFATRTNVRKANINYQIADVNSQIAKNNLNKTINQAVLDVRAADKKYESTKQTYQSNKDAYDVVQQRYNVGLINSLDYNTSLTTLNKSEFDMIQAKYELIFRSKIIDYYLGNPITL